MPNVACVLVSLRVRSLVALFVFGLCTTYAFAGNPLSCHQKVTERGATGGGKVQVNGFTVDVKPIPDPTVPGHMDCHVSVTSPQGKVVYEDSDWGMEIDPITGSDINGDGQPSAVLVGFSGGAHCCWTYHIISLGKKPGLIREFENRAPASFKDLQGNGQVEILIRDGSFDEGFGLDHAFSVFPLLIVQLKGTKFQDVGPEFWPVFEAEIQQARDKLTNQQLQEFLRSNPYEPHDDLDYQKTRSTILLIVLDYLYAGRHDEAKKVLGELWPPASQQRTWKEMVGGYCSGLRAQLGLESNPPCGGN